MSTSLHTKEMSEIRILERVSLPVPGADGSEFILFSGEHFALIYPQINSEEAPLVRLHSECLTGDVAGSLRCDCGEQLGEAKKKLAKEGGYLLYLRQEGRGHGLLNKLKSYNIQKEQELDTFEAGNILGHAEDIRDYVCAAEMLRLLGVDRIRLLTNNPDKAEQLKRYGCNVVRSVQTEVFKNPHNERYLIAKKNKGHTLKGI